MDIEITKDSDYLICSLYKAYLQKRSNGSFNTRVGVRWFLKDFAKKYDIRGFNTRVGVRWFIKNKQSKFFIILIIIHYLQKFRQLNTEPK